MRTEPPTLPATLSDSQFLSHAWTSCKDFGDIVKGMLDVSKKSIHESDGTCRTLKPAANESMITRRCRFTTKKNELHVMCVGNSHLCLLRRRNNACANSPNWLVGNHHISPVAESEAVFQCTHLLAKHIPELARLALR